MALRKEAATTTETATSPNPTPVGAFEAPDDDTVNTPAANDGAAPAEAAASAPAPETAPVQSSAQRAVALAKTRGVALTDGTAIKKLQNVFDQDALESLGFGTFPRITIGLDGFSVNKNEKQLGLKIKFELVSWNFVWIITTGEKENNAETNKLIKTSYDGVNLVGNEGTIDRYVAWLKAEGYENAVAKQYVELYGFLLAHNEVQKDGSLKLVEIPEDERELHQVSLSPKSVGQFQAHMITTALKKQEGSNILIMGTVKKVNGPNSFGMAQFLPKW